MVTSLIKKVCLGLHTFSYYIYSVFALMNIVAAYNLLHWLFVYDGVSMFRELKAIHQVVYECARSKDSLQ